jgi:small conductance mechanosensitive channel
MIRSYEDLLARLNETGWKAGKALVIFIAFWIASAIVDLAIRRFVHRDAENADLILLLARTAKISLLVFGAVTALGSADINVSALVAGLGLTGFALGFALGDILSNVLAGVLILMYRPFLRGDRIAVTGFEGTVCEIDLRYTILDAGDKRVLIPNSNLFTNPITVARRSEENP